jgi:hypothetical protein
MTSIMTTTRTTPFDIPELLDTILVLAALKLRALLRLRKVHSTWRTAIDKGSPDLRRTLYLAALAPDQRSYLLEEQLDAESWHMPKKIVSSVPSLAGYKFVGTAANLHPALVSLRSGTFLDRECCVMRLSYATFRRWYFRLPASVRQWKYMYISQPPPLRVTIAIHDKHEQEPKSMVVERSEGIRMCDLLSGLQRVCGMKGGEKGWDGWTKVSVMDMAMYDDKEEAMGKIETFW